MATAEGAKTLYFPEVSRQWQDWIQVINVSDEPTRVTAIAHHHATGKPVWSEEKEIDSFESWIPNLESIKENTWVQFNAEQSIVAERHMHNGSNIIDLIGAAEAYETVGKRLFFPEVSSGAMDWFRFLNISEHDALISMVVRNVKGETIWQHQHTIKPKTCWDVHENVMKQANGTLEVVSTQPICGERHMHYQGGKTTVGQYGQVITDQARTLYFPEVGPAWHDWVAIVNLSTSERAHVKLIARQDSTGKPVWSKEKQLAPFERWSPPMDEVKIKSSVEVTSDQPVAAERHMHSGTALVDLPGASEERGHVGRRLFFPEIHAGDYDWFRVLNISEHDAMVSMVVRNRKGEVVTQFQGSIKPFHCWDFDDSKLKDVRGTVEIVSTQPIIGERHMHYKNGHKGAVVGEYGIVIGG
jgi:hypothetical protein